MGWRQVGPGQSPVHLQENRWHKKYCLLPLSTEATICSRTFPRIFRSHEAFMIDMSSPSAHFYVRTSVAIAGAVVGLLLAGRWILKRPADQVTVGHVIAFDAVAFIIAGFAFVISASE